MIDDVLIPPEAHGVRLISMGFFVNEDQPIIWRGPMLHKALNQFLTDVHWDDPEYLIVDMPPGTGDIALSMAQFLPRAEVIVVTTPQPAAQKVAQRAAYMARKVNLRVVGVIENMSWFRADDGKAYEIFGEGGGQELADDLDVPLVGKVPLVPALREGSDEGTPDRRLGARLGGGPGLRGDRRAPGDRSRAQARLQVGAEDRLIGGASATNPERRATRRRYASQIVGCRPRRSIRSARVPATRSTTSTTRSTRTNPGECDGDGMCAHQPCRSRSREHLGGGERLGGLRFRRRAA
ncbi:MAG: Mrp/NBP35 family ATP-binding protein [Acidimicrobiia bacterium]|nr:Mrp/NBP35 family ATP-binding protein [Acidimicrobiia bacterium]